MGSICLLGYVGIMVLSVYVASVYERLTRPRETNYRRPSDQLSQFRSSAAEGCGWAERGQKENLDIGTISQQDRSSAIITSFQRHQRTGEHLYGMQ